MGGDYRPFGYMPGFYQANMMGMPQYQQQAMYGLPHGLQGMYTQTANMCNQLKPRPTPVERIAMSELGPCPKDEKKRNVWLHKLGEYLNDMDKRLDAAIMATAQAEFKRDVAKGAVRRMKRKMRQRASQAARTAILSSFGVIGAFGVWACTWGSGPEFWPLKVFGFCLWGCAVLYCVMAWVAYDGYDCDKV
jgi:hypothetical protein